MRGRACSWRSVITLLVVCGVGSGCTTAAARVESARPHRPAPIVGSLARVATRPPSVARPAPVRPRVTGLLAKVVFRVPTNKRVVFVTVDDGFTRDARVVSFIAAMHWPITAFVIAAVAAQDPAFFKRLAAAGATIEDHTVDHPQLPRLDAAHQHAQICRPRTTFPRLLGSTPRLLRPPYGEYNDTTRHLAAACGFSTLILWNATILDGVVEVVGHRPFHPGDIILLHFRPAVYRDLTALAAVLALAGLQVGRLEDYVCAAAAYGNRTREAATSRAVRVRSPGTR